MFITRFNIDPIQSCIPIANLHFKLFKDYFINDKTIAMFDRNNRKPFSFAALWYVEVIYEQHQRGIEIFYARNSGGGYVDI